jgi:hypothetical protein
MRILVNVIAAIMMTVGVTWFLQDERLVPMHLISRQFPGSEHGIWVALGGAVLLVLGSMFSKRA